MLPIEYHPNFVAEPDAVFDAFKNDLSWERRGSTPRSEYYINSLGDIPYTYGKGEGRRQYLPQKTHPEIEKIKERLRDYFEHLGRG